MAAQSSTLPAGTVTDQATIEWLLDGDPAIRWQVLRDLLSAPEPEWRFEQQQTMTQGWGARLLAQQEPEGGWGGGVYSPKWVSTTYTLLMLRSIGLPRDCAAAQTGAALMLKQMLGESCDTHFSERLAACDRCIVGMLLLVAVYFGVDDARVEAIVQNLLDEQMPDGGWNCRRHRRPYPTHSSFHTTFNVLEGLREYLELRNTALSADVAAAEQQALEFMLQHKLFRSDRTGAVINEKFTHPVFPHRWHYDILRGLAYFARVNAPRDARLQEAIDLLTEQRRPDGRWAIGKQYTGKVFFTMETSGPSRWNTLRALRVLQWWNKAKDYHV